MSTVTETACGTYAGYQTHKRRNTEPCAACRRANRDYQRAHRASSQQRRDKDYAYTTARTRAIARLIALHPAQWEALLADERARA